ncbi:MAG: glycosyltransferase family 39 protein [Rickettsiales bacterium]
MIESSAISWVLLFSCVFLYSIAGLGVSRFIPFSVKARAIGLNFFVGLSIAPFLMGFTTILSLWLFSGYELAVHLSIIFIAAIFLCVVTLIPFRGELTSYNLRWNKSLSFDETFIFILFLAFVSLLLVNSLFFPLTQNDSLEYASVARIFYDSRDLSVYPVLNSQDNRSGFYAPWTHPPFYPAMIYAFYLLQGSSEHVGFARLITPYFAILCVLLTYSLGCLINRRAGLFAAIFLVSTPLFFLGADSGLIDSIPILALLLIFTMTIAIESSPIKTGIIQGVFLGASLWTHSQAILFIPLSAFIILAINGVLGWKRSFIQILFMTFVACLLASYPYVRNLEIYGALVSDNNLVYALPELGWKDYFNEARGLNSPVSVMQYGILKGWFMIEYYGIIFWLMTLAAIVFLCRNCSFASCVFGKTVVEIEKNQSYLLFGSLLIVLAYLSGVVLSVFIKTDVMVRNERYLLVIFPFIAILSGWLMAVFISGKTNSNLKDKIKYLFVILILLVVTLQLVFFSKYRFDKNAISIASINKPQKDKLLNFPEMRVMDFINRKLASNSLILSSQPANMYYSGRKMVSYLDPRLLDFYKTKDPKIGLEILREIGVTHIHITDYSLPIFYNSVLKDIVSSPDMSSLIYSYDGSQLYNLKDSGLSYSANAIDISPEKITWEKFKQYRFLGKKGGMSSDDTSSIWYGNSSVSTFPFGLFQRNFSTILSTSKNPDSAIKISSSKEYVVEFNVSGKGFTSFFMEQYDKNGSLIKSTEHTSLPRIMLGDIIIGNEITENKFIRRIKSMPNASFIRIIIEQHGNSILNVNSAKIIALNKHIKGKHR